MKRLLLISSDDEYVINIIGTLTEEISEDYQIEVITDMEYLKSYTKTPHKVDTLLIDESLMAIYPEGQSVAHKYLITETDRIGANVISKYSGVQGIMKILGTDYLRRSKRDDDVGKTRIHDIISIDNPNMNTVAAITIAKHLSAYGRKVLYISANNLQDFNVYMKEREVYSGIEEAMVIKAIVKGITGKLEQLVKNDDFDYIPQFKHLLSSYDMTSGTMFFIAEEIKKLDIYDDIIIDHPYGFSAETVTRLENSKSIVIVSNQNEDTKRILDKFLDNTKEVRENSVIICCSGEHEGTFAKENTFCGVNVCERLGKINPDKTIEELVEMKAFRDTAEALL